MDLPDLPKVKPVRGWQQLWDKYGIQVLTIFVLAVSLSAIAWGVKRKSNFSPKASGEQARIYFSSQSATLPPDTSVSVMVDTGSLGLAFAKVEVDFDATAVQLVADPVIPSSNGLKTVISRTSLDAANSSGKMLVSLGLAPGDVAPSGNFEFMNLVFTPANSDTLLSNVVIPSAGNQLVGSDARTLTYSGDNLALNLNPAPAATETPVPTEVPLPTDEVNPTATTAPTAVPTAMPTATTVPSNNTGGSSVNTPSSTPVPPTPTRVVTVRWVTATPALEETIEPTMAVVEQPTETPIPEVAQDENSDKRFFLIRWWEAIVLFVRSVLGIK